MTVHSAQAVMLHMRDGNYHTMRAFPFIQRALESVSPSDLHAHLDATHDTLPEITRSLGVWARYPLMEKSRALGLGVDENMHELSVATWDSTQPATRDVVLIASMVYGDTLKNSHVVPPYPFMNTISAAAVSKLPSVRAALTALPYPEAYTEWIAAETAVSAMQSGVLTDEELTTGISLALEVVPHFTVDGEPVTGLLDAALDEWLRPLYRVGATWEQVCAYERGLISAFAR